MILSEMFPFLAVIGFINFFGSMIYFIVHVIILQAKLRDHLREENLKL